MANKDGEDWQGLPTTEFKPFSRDAATLIFQFIPCLLNYFMCDLKKKLTPYFYLCVPVYI